MSTPNAIKIPLLRRNKYKHSSEHDSQYSFDLSDLNNYSFLPVTVPQGTYDKAQKLQLLQHAKQTLHYIDLSTSSTIIQANQIIVHAMKNEVNSQQLLEFVSCLDHGLRMLYFKKESWTEYSLAKALVALKNDNNLRVLWSNMLSKMHLINVDNELGSNLLCLFVTKFTKRRCVTYLAVDGFGPSPHQDNSAIRQLLKKYDLIVDKKMETIIDSTAKSKSKCHGCGELGHWVRECPKGYNKNWLTTQTCFKCNQLGHFRRDCPFKVTTQKSKAISFGSKKQTGAPEKMIWYHPSSALPKMIGMLDSCDLDTNNTYVPLSVDNSHSKTTKQGSDQWFNYRKGKINGSKAAVSLGWYGKPAMENYWNQLRQGEKAVNSETSFQNNLAMKWGTMCEKSAMATYISKFLSRTYPKSKVSETGVHIINDENGIPWLASSPDGLVQIETITDCLGVVEIKCPFMGGKPVPYKSVCVNHIPQVMLEMYCTNTNWCHYVVWTPVGYSIYLVERDDEYIADLLSYLKTFWNSANEREGIMPNWQADALNLKKRAECISKKCRKLSSGNSLRDNGILEHDFINLFWNSQTEKKNDKKLITPRKCGGCKVEEWKCKLNPCEMRLEKRKNKNILVAKPQSFYQSYTWGSGGLGNSCHQDTVLEFLYHPFRRQIQIPSNSGKGMCVLEECFKLRENGDLLESKLKLWKWLRDETDNGQMYYSFGRSASIIGIFFRLMENSDESFTLNFRITEKTSTLCSLQPQKHSSQRIKHHVIFPLTDDDILQEHASPDHTYKINLVVEHLLTRKNQLLPSGRCGNVISDTNAPDSCSCISEITAKTAKFCDGTKRVTSEATSNPKFFFVTRNTSSTYIPNVDENIHIANTKYKLTGIVYFNGIHYWCEVISTQIGYKNGWYFYDGMMNGGRATYVGDTVQSIQKQYIHILLYEQCTTHANEYGKTLSYEKDKLNSIISFYKHMLNLSDNKVKIKNLKEILRHEAISFENNARLDELKTLVLNIPDGRAQNTSPMPNSVPDIGMTTPPSVKDMPSVKRMSGSPKKTTDYTPERHAPKKLKTFFSPLKKSFVKKKITKCIKTFKDLVHRVTGPDDTAHSSSEDESDQCQFNTVQDSNPFFKYLEDPLPEEIQDSKSNSYLAKSFSSELPFQMVATEELWEFREFDRLITPKVEDGGARLEQIRRYVLKFGIESPLILAFNQKNGKVYLAEGNHRLAVAMSEGIPYLPVHVTSQWLEPNESGNYKIMANHLEISNISEELLPQHFGLKVKSTLCE